MHYSTSITTTFNCSLETAFKTPMLSDICKVHSGYGFTPKATHCLDDTTWGKPGGSRRVFMAKNIAFKGGEAALDTVIERRENEYWKIEIGNMKMFSFGFYKFQGEWSTKKINETETEVIYKYTMFSNIKWAEPFQYWFTKIIWRNYMQHVLKNIKEMAKNEEPYLFD